MVELKDYQREAVKLLKTGSILCGGVGSGKTLTSIAYYYKVCQVKPTVGIFGPMKNPMDCVVITTAKKRDTLDWEGEFAMIGAYPDTLNKVNLIIDSWNNIKKYEKAINTFFIFDEQRLVGSGAWVSTFIKISKCNPWILLSATPGDTWKDYIPVFIANGFYKNKTEFNKEHVIYKAYRNYPEIDKFINTRKLEHLRSSILIGMKDERHTKRFYHTVPVEYDKKKYNTILMNRWNPYSDEPIKDASDMCINLRKVAYEDYSRVAALKNIMKQNDKVIVFYNFNFELEILRTKLGDTHEIAEWNGHKHQPIPETSKWVYLVQYTAGAEGWNCVETNTIVFYSLNYSYKIMEQASGRIDRMNTPFTELQYHKLLSKSTIDRAVQKAIDTKKIFNAKAFA